MSDESRSFDLPDVERFTTGTTGPKGARTFFLQVTQGVQTVSLKLEKQQVHALAEYLENMLSDLPAADPTAIPTSFDLIEPVDPEWVVSSMGVAYQQSENRIIFWTEEAVPEDESDDVYVPATARFRITIAQAVGFIERAREAVAAGRPPCRFCSAPLDSEDAWCPCSN